MHPKTKIKLNLIEELINQGYTEEEVGLNLNQTRQGISYLICRYLPHLKKSERKKKPIEKQIRTDLEKRQQYLLSRKRANARRIGYEINLNYSDLTWPEVCPILGLTIDYYAESRQENSPSFDRINSNIGYLPGNVRVISWRANRIKNDGTAEEHKKIADYLETYKKGVAI